MKLETIANEYDDLRRLRGQRYSDTNKVYAKITERQHSPLQFIRSQINFW